jgi:hypothetical protein
VGIWNKQLIQNYQLERAKNAVFRKNMRVPQELSLISPDSAFPVQVNPKVEWNEDEAS